LGHPGSLSGGKGKLRGGMKATLKKTNHLTIGGGKKKEKPNTNRKLRQPKKRPKVGAGRWGERPGKNSCVLGQGGQVPTCGDKEESGLKKIRRQKRKTTSMMWGV